MAQAEREDIRRLTSYPEGTAGAVMTSDYATLHRDLTAAGAIESLREAAPDTETIYTSYVVNENRELLGYVKLQGSHRGGEEPQGPRDNGEGSDLGTGNG